MGRSAFRQDTCIDLLKGTSQHTLHSYVCNALTGARVARVTPRILWIDVVDHKCSPPPCLPNVVLGTGAKTEFSSPPLQGSTNFGELTAQAHTVPFFHRLVFQLFRENNWGGWRTKGETITLWHGVWGQEWQRERVVRRKRNGLMKGWKWDEKMNMVFLLPFTTRHPELTAPPEQQE